MTTRKKHIQEAQRLLEEAKIAYQTDRQSARILAEQSLDTCRTINHPSSLAQALDLVGRIYQPIGLLAKAKELMEEGLDLRQVSGNQRGAGISLRNLANLAGWTGDFEEAEELIHQSLSIFSALGDTQQLTTAIHSLHGILVYGGKFTESVDQFEGPAPIYKKWGLPHKPEEPTIVSAFALMHLGRYDEAEARFRETLSIYPETSVGYAIKNLGRIALVQEKYDEAETHLLEALNLFRHAEDMNGLGQTLGCLGILALRLGNQKQAQGYIDENRQIAADTLIILPSMTALSSLASLCVEDGDAGKAIELYTAASQTGHVANSQWYQDVAGQHIDSAAESLSSEAEEAAKARGRRLGSLCYRIDT